MTTQMAIILRAPGNREKCNHRYHNELAPLGRGRDDDHTTQMTISRAGEGGEVGASCLLPKRQSAMAPGQGRGGGGRAACPNCPNDNQPQRRGWRRATDWGGAAAGRRSTPWRCLALWQGCTGRGVAPPSYRRCRLPRVRRRSCTAGTWLRRALCVLDRMEGYRERSSPAGGLGYVSGSVGWG
jgi:hypothetical protein